MTGIRDKPDSESSDSSPNAASVSHRRQSQLVDVTHIHLSPCGRAQERADPRRRR